MPTEAELRQRLHDESGPPIDADAVVRLARRRRRPRTIAVGATATLALLGIGIAGITGLRGVDPMSASDSTQGGSAESAAPTADEYGFVRSPASAPIVCGGTIASEGASSGGLAIATGVPDTTNGDVVAGSITLSNTGGTRIVGTATAPTFALLRDGVVVGYGDDPALVGAGAVDLVPGGTTEYEVVATPVSCPGGDGPGSDGPGSDGRDLDVLPPGDYELSAVIDFSPEFVASSSDVTGSVRLTAPAEPVTLG